MPTSERPNTRPGSAPSPRTPFSEHHPIPITFFVPRSRILPSQASFHCHTRAHKPAPLLTILPHLRHLYAASPPQAAPTGSASANQAPPYGSALGPGPPEGGGPAKPRGDHPAEACTPGSEQQGVGVWVWGRGGGWGGGWAAGTAPASTGPASTAPRAAARARRGGARRQLLQPGVPASHLVAEALASLSSRPSSEGSAAVAVALSSLALPPPQTGAEERTGSGKPIGCGPYSRQPAPTRTSECDWLARRLFSKSCPDWLSRAPYQRTAHPPPGSGLPPPQPRFHPGGRGTRRANGRAERGSGGGLCSRPARGASSANGRTPHIPGSGAPPLAASVPAGLAHGHARAARRLEAAPGGKAGKMRRSGSERPRVAIVACSSTVYVRPSARLGEAGSGR